MNLIIAGFVLLVMIGLLFEFNRNRKSQALTAEGSLNGSDDALTADAAEPTNTGRFKVKLMLEEQEKKSKEIKHDESVEVDTDEVLPDPFA